MDALINLIGDFVCQLSQLLPASPAIGFMLLGSIPVIYIAGALINDRRA